MDPGPLPRRTARPGQPRCLGAFGVQPTSPQVILHPFLCSNPRNSVDFVNLFKVGWNVASTDSVLQNRLRYRNDIEEPYLSSQKSRDRNLVGGIQRGRRP